MRLNKFLARSGLASRRRCDDLIKNKKINVNGKVVTDFSTQVKPDDIILCNGTIIEYLPEVEVYILNKPKGYISTSNDPFNRKRVIDLINKKGRYFTIGRLDRDTTGAILLTNDGELANILMHPNYGVEKKYIISTKDNIPDFQLNKLIKGLRIDQHTIAKGKIKKLYKNKSFHFWEIILKEGKNREVKKIILAMGSRVVNLHRKSFAGITADNLSMGKYRMLNKKEVNNLRKYSK
tara:strand:- start:429 stop:1136 length:708 start_codon:yes stop_codon:yes gene_type:complete